MFDRSKSRIAPLALRATAGLLMLAVLTLTASCGGRGSQKPEEPDYFADMRSVIIRSVKDISRSQAMAGELDLMQRIFVDARRQAGEYGAELRALVDDYQSSPEDFEALFERMNAEAMIMRERVFDAQLRLKVLATDREWSRIARAQEPVLREQLRLFEELRKPQVRAALDATITLAARED